MNFVELSDEVFRAYNEQDFDALEKLAAPNFHYIHYHRGTDFYERNSPKDYVDTVRHYAGASFKERRYEAVRTTTQGNIVSREAWFKGQLLDEESAAVQALANAGETFNVGLVSVHSFDDQGRLLEWKDYG